MSKNGVNFNEHDLGAAFKRMDIYKYGKVSISDFRSLLNKPDFDRNFETSSFYQSKSRLNVSMTTKNNSSFKYTS